MIKYQNKNAPAWFKSYLDSLPANSNATAFTEVTLEVVHTKPFQLDLKIAKLKSGRGKLEYLNGDRYYVILAAWFLEKPARLGGPITIKTELAHLPKVGDVISIGEHKVKKRVLKVSKLLNEYTLEITGGAYNLPSGSLIQLMSDKVTIEGATNA